jgi:hypothetical protein
MSIVLLKTLPCREYVTRVFDECPKKHRDNVELELKQIILEAFQSGQLWTRDWTSFPMPVCVLII